MICARSRVIGKDWWGGAVGKGVVGFFVKSDVGRCWRITEMVTSICHVLNDPRSQQSHNLRVSYSTMTDVLLYSGVSHI